MGTHNKKYSFFDKEIDEDDETSLSSGDDSDFASDGASKISCRGKRRGYEGRDYLKRSILYLDVDCFYSIGCLLGAHDLPVVNCLWLWC